MTTPRAFQTRVEESTGVVWLVSGDGEAGTLTWICPLKQAAVIMDLPGNFAEVSEDGALKVADFGATPIMGTDATGGDAYVTVLVAHKKCRTLAAGCATNGAAISLDGGKTNHLALSPGNQVFTGLDIPIGATVQAKNLTAGSNYAALGITVW